MHLESNFEADTQSVLQMLQTSIESQLKNINDNLDSIKCRLNELEARQKFLEDRMASSSPSGMNSTPQLQASATATGIKRKRITPPALQVMHFFINAYFSTSLYSYWLQSKVRMVHSALDEDKQFKPNEP